jgi:hypothetical protein
LEPPRNIRRLAQKAATEAVKFATASNSLEQAFKRLGWTWSEAFTIEGATELLTKWNIPLYRTTEFALDFNMGKGVTVHKRRKYTKQLTDKWSITVSDNNVAEDEILAEAICEQRAAQPGVAVNSLKVKIAFDGAQFTHNRKNLQVATVSFPDMVLLATRCHLKTRMYCG